MESPIKFDTGMVELSIESNALSVFSPIWGMAGYPYRIKQF